MVEIWWYGQRTLLPNLAERSHQNINFRIKCIPFPCLWILSLKVKRYIHIFLRILNQKIIRFKFKFFDIQCCDYINFFPCIWILNLKVKKSLFRISISLAIFKFDCDISDLIRHALLFFFRLINLYLENDHFYKKKKMNDHSHAVRSSGHEFDFWLLNGENLTRKLKFILCG